MSIVILGHAAFLLDGGGFRCAGSPVDLLSSRYQPCKCTVTCISQPYECGHSHLSSVRSVDACMCRHMSEVCGRPGSSSMCDFRPRR